MINNQWFICYIVVINIIAFILYGLDKLFAMTKSYRIKEATLITISILGGSLGAMLGMNVFHHKTLKPVFKFGIPIIFIVQVVVLIIINQI